MCKREKVRIMEGERGKRKQKINKNGEGVGGSG